MMVHFIQNRTSTFPVNSCQKPHETFHFKYLYCIFVREDLLLNRERNPYEETKGVFGSLVSIPIPACPSQ